MIIGIDYSISCPAVCVYSGKAPNPPLEACQYYYLTSVLKYQGTFYTQPNAVTAGFKNHIGSFEGKLHAAWAHPMQRYSHMADWVLNIIAIQQIFNHEYTTPLVVLENYGFNASGRITDIAEHTGILKKKLYDANISYTTCTPSQVKKALCGRGNASKEEIAQHYTNTPSIFRPGKSPLSDCIDAYGLVLAHLSNP